MTALRQLRGRLAREDGFTMVIAIGVMLVAGLLLVVAFTAANGDVRLSHQDTAHKQAYYAALAGVQAYEAKLQANPNYWETCEKPNGSVPQEANESYEIKLLAANKKESCSTSNPFETMIESKGALANTFRIESIGYVGGATRPEATRKLIATFQVSGFLNYIYFTQYEVGDPELTGTSAECGMYYRPEREAKGLSCFDIYFAEGDNVNGPMHTDDASLACGEVEFGRKSHVPPDVVEINHGVNSSKCGFGGGKPIFNTPTGTYVTGPEIIAPESDTSLGVYVEHEPQQNEFKGVTHLVLEGTKIKVTTIEAGKTVEKPIEWPKNGLIYVASKGCGYTYNFETADTSTAAKEEENCGNVFVSGTYSKSLTIGGENEVIINGNVAPTGVTLGSAPPGTTTLGLIATRYVRVYHPCESGTNRSGTMTEPYIYAAILSTNHSFVVDNYNCGSKLKNLNVWGAIAQKFRGPVGTGSGGGGTGYEKEYQYDDRLATGEPPYFLAPLKAGWKIARETAPSEG
jgi:Tfp pilus assembly protein PilE